MKKTLIFVMCAAVFAACAPRATEYSFYTLSDTGRGGEQKSSRRITVDIERVKIPEYIDRPQIVTTDGTAVVMSRKERWAENLSPMIQRKLISDIGSHMPRASVKDSNFMADSGQYSVFVEIYKLDGPLDGDVRLVGIYSIMGAAGETLRTKNVKYSAPAGSNYDNYVDAINTMVEKLGADIAAELGR